MSVISIKKLNLFIFFTLTILSSLYFLNKKTPQKLNHNSFLVSEFSSKGVAQKIIQTTLSNSDVSEKPELSNMNVEINVPFDLNAKMYFKWKLGQDIEIESGNLTGEISGIKKNQPQHLSITVKGFKNAGNHHVGFEIYSTQNGKKIFGDTLIASEKENTFENIVQNVERLKASE